MMNAAMNAETPQITNSCYGSTTHLLGTAGDVLENATNQFIPGSAGAGDFIYQLHQFQPQPLERKVEIMTDKTTRRIVQVFIADPNENVPLEKSVLYTGEPKLTDLIDTELFFEVPIQDLLKKHNEVRKTVVDKEASKRAGKDILLDPVKIRDLRMVVVTVAQF
jgi:hypothetical protein